MKVFKLPWLSHRAENKSVEIYALDVNKAGTKLASGGLDGKVKVWDVSSIVNYQETSKEDGDLRPETSLLKRMEAPANALERPLASMSRHNGVVTSVKFSPDGRFLASGSDDKIVLVWEKDNESAPRPKQFGEAEADLEHWTVRKRLVAHDNDVQDICWAPDGQLLITVGLDRSIIIWNGTTFERIKRYDIHQSMVKGIVFDPANKFFATASDDRSVRIFRFHKKFNDTLSGSNYEFHMEQVVTDPFRKSPLTSYFRRMSWSPDGQHIAVPNATNGPVTAVAVINRGNWASDVSLIGHEAPCEVCSFSPKLFKIQTQAEAHTTILASAGQDRTLAIWSTALSKPLVVLEDLTRKSVTDLAWAPDGTTLFASSLDGSITCVLFGNNELGEPVGADAIGSQLERYGGDRDSATLVESVDQLWLEKLAKGDGSARVIPAIASPRISAFSSNPEKALPYSPKSAPSPLTTISSPKRAKKVAHNEITTKGGKKRVAPTLISTYGGTSYSGSSGMGSTSISQVSKPFIVPSKLSRTAYNLPKAGLQTAVHGLRLESEHPHKGESAEAEADNDNEDMGFNDPNSAHSQPLTAAGIRLKLKKFRKSLMSKKYPTPFKKIATIPEVLFSNQQIMNSELSRLLQSDKVNSADAELINTSSLESIDEGVFFRVVVNTTKHKLPSSFRDVCAPTSSKEMVFTVIEVRNGPAWPEDDEILNTDPRQRTDFQDPTQVIVRTSANANESKRSYVLYFPFRIQHAIPIILNEHLEFYVLVSLDGSVQIIRALTGSYFYPCFELGSNVVFSKQQGQYFTVLTSLGQVFCWKFPMCGDSSLEKILSGVSVAAVVNAETVISTKKIDPKDGIDTPVLVDTVRALDVNENTGMPIIVMDRTTSVYTFSRDLMTWTKLLDPWYFLAYKKDELCDVDMGFKPRYLLDAVADSKHESIQKGDSESYRFNEKNQEIKECMRKRFEELVQL